MGKLKDKSLNDILSRSVAEKILAVETIWDSIAEESEKIPVSDAQLSLVKDRLKEYKRDTSNVKTWEEVKKNYLKRK